MSLWYNLVIAKIDLAAIAHNYELLKTKGSKLIPVIKADAYGHGLGPVAVKLAALGATQMAVGTVHEAAALRLTPFEGRIISLLGPQTDDDCSHVLTFGITPVLYRLDQLRMLGEAIGGNDKQVDVVLKFATGMNRLGFDPDETDVVIGELQNMACVGVHGVCSHLASADVPGDASVTEQAGRFERVCAKFREAGHTFQSNLANSAALLAYPELKGDAQRPGIALYGANPFYGTAWEKKGAGLRPAMEVRAPVLSVHALKKGEGISYGLTFRATKDMTVAIVGVGYADNYSRGLSNTGEMVLRGHRVPVLGRVCMQLTAVDVSHVPEAAPGDEVFVLGGDKNSVTPEELAAWWGTIPYEVFCLLGQNKREYVG